MKKDTHPKTYTSTKVVCSCGNTFVTTSTLEDIHVEVCSNCHPFYTGVDKFVDTEGRVEKFQKKQDLASKKRKEVEARIAKKKEKEKQQAQGPLSLKDMLKAAGK